MCTAYLGGRVDRRRDTEEEEDNVSQCGFFPSTITIFTYSISRYILVKPLSFFLLLSFFGGDGHGRMGWDSTGRLYQTRLFVRKCFKRGGGGTRDSFHKACVEEEEGNESECKKELLYKVRTVVLHNELCLASLRPKTIAVKRPRLKQISFHWVGAVFLREIPAVLAMQQQKKTKSERKINNNNS